MENITYQNINISGVDYDRLAALQITHNAGEHAYALLELEVSWEYGQNYMRRADETTAITITTDAQGQHKILFVGCVLNVGLQETADYVVMKLRLVSASHMLDIKRNKKTFQNTDSTYGDVMRKTAKDMAEIKLAVSDKKTNDFIMQYSETDWCFIKRMASQLSATVFTEIDSVKPTIHIGVPMGSTLPAPADITFTGSSSSKSATNSVICEKYYFIGERMSVGGKEYVIGSVKCSMELGVLKCTYDLGNNKSFQCTADNNKQLAGRMFIGEVKAVKGDKVQVFFTGIDSEYDEGGTKWFPYSTAYSSGDGSGFYCMPEAGDSVRIFIPSNNEKDAFAASSVNNNPQSNTRNKSWKAPGGKEILLADDGIYIICEKEKIYINLTSSEGIEIHSEKAVQITSDSNIIFQSGGEIQLKAEGYINLGVGNSSVYIDETQIQMGADGVYVN